MFFKPQLAKDFKYIRKQGMQLASKMRFLSVQMEALFTDNLWLKNAKSANSMAAVLAESLEQIPEIKITREVQTNMVYCTIPPQVIEKIWEYYLFYVFDRNNYEVRLVTNYDTTTEDVLGFVEVAQKAIASM